MPDHLKKSEHQKFWPNVTRRFHLRVVMLVCIVCPILNEPVSAADAPPTNVPLGVVRIVQPRLGIRVPKTTRTFDVGNRAVLFQENEQFYIVVVDDKSGAKGLVATPRRKGDEKLGWVTPENILFFGFRAESVEGVFYLAGGEELPVVREESGRYHVQVRRGQEAVTVELPKAHPGLMFIPNPVVETAGLSSPEKVLVGEPLQRSPESGVSGTKGGIKPRSGSSQERLAVLPVSETEKILSALDTNWESNVLSFLLPDEWAVVTRPSPSGEASSLWRRFDLGVAAREKVSLLEVAKERAQWIVALILALMLLGAGAVSVWRRMLLTRQAARESAPPPPPAQSAAEPPVLLTAPPAPDFSGSLASMALAAVLQFLNSDKETGTLTLYAEDHTAIASVFFAEGEIVDARAGKKLGVQAVYEIMGIKDGHFAFVRSKTQNVPRVIDQPTMTLLLEANRILDETKEQQPHEPAAKGSKRKDSLRLRRHASH